MVSGDEEEEEKMTSGIDDDDIRTEDEEDDDDDDDADRDEPRVEGRMVVVEVKKGGCRLLKTKGVELMAAA